MGRCMGNRRKEIGMETFSWRNAKINKIHKIRYNFGSGWVRVTLGESRSHSKKNW